MDVLNKLDQNGRHYLEQLLTKFDSSEQSVSCHLEGLYRSSYQNYWDYLRLNTLLSTQNPKTSFPDEMVFILYHQVAELYFRMILWEMEQITREDRPVDEAFFLEKCERICRYFRQLVTSMEVMTEGLDARQFLQFRTSLTPASGFQSAQYRMIELNATSLRCLCGHGSDGLKEGMASEELYQRIYWKNGAKSRLTGNKDQSLKDFEIQYDRELIRLAEEKATTNLYALYLKYYRGGACSEQIKNALRQMDKLANVDWPLMHYRAAATHLGGGVKGTGGTNWKEYLPPKRQRIIFFPDLHSTEELDNWGKGAA
ncbi:tryptophan 2,3-dioxygenase family protein [Roseivirga sp. BDSF3-8]|uniref:tryptophan 2,3-dioxygenase family protein n=1 Tax=Roseivirga sp. BDSF3-8 TaxID=3241598 RepID=UPI003531EEA0